MPLLYRLALNAQKVFVFKKAVTDSGLGQFIRSRITVFQLKCSELRTFFSLDLGLLRLLYKEGSLNFNYSAITVASIVVFSQRGL